MKVTMITIVTAAPDLRPRKIVVIMVVIMVIVSIVLTNHIRTAFIWVVNTMTADGPMGPRRSEGKMTALAYRAESGSTTISLRIPVQRRELIDRAARATGKTRTEFILESAGRAAEDALLDQRMFHLNEEEHRAFMAALDAPPRPEAVAALRKLFAQPAPWER